MTEWEQDFSPEDIRRGKNWLYRNLTQAERNRIGYHWESVARPEQLPPEGDWRIWLIMAGRGFGKTRAGAEWVRRIADDNPAARIALVGTSLAEARSVMVEGESGLLSIYHPNDRPRFEPSLHRLHFRSGATAQLFSAAEPEGLRGPQHSHAWCDEIGKWPLAHDRALRCWNNLLMGLRLGSDIRITVTTTPRSVPLMHRFARQRDTGDVVQSGGSTLANERNLPDRFLEAMETEFGDTLLARQELGGELLHEVEGALWNRALLESLRHDGPLPEHRRVVVAVDPPASADGDECGIIIAALGEDGIARVIADCSLAKPSPAQWAAAVAQAAREHGADRVVAEANQGGAMVEHVMRAADQSLPIKLVHAARGKVARAEPVAALYAAGRVRHLGMFARLEDQMCGLMVGGSYAGPGRSPDRADALVWALTELMLGRASVPSIRAL